MQDNVTDDDEWAHMKEYQPSPSVPPSIPPSVPDTANVSVRTQT